jgi:hypothetical protein
VNKRAFVAEKADEEKILCSLDLTPMVPPGSTVESHEFHTYTTSWNETDAITVEDDTVDDLTFTFMVSGGVRGQRYIIEFFFTLSDEEVVGSRFEYRVI